ncbi:unnamed protein product [Blepharisma stoltei]|uniref:Uncharacterized protein n=1 Tax=Blepharisma stoltei TaxID=1481888 RepID=A0AAU9IJ19_9CILI|nr:unnamed protein product [Blepharisma stoltei]
MLSANFNAVKNIPDSIISTPYSALSNSYLQETDHNSEIDESIRNEIENKFLKSKVNQTYTFPRKRISTTLQDDLTRKDYHLGALIGEKNKRSLKSLLTQKVKLSKIRTVNIQSKSQKRVKSLSMLKGEFLINFNHKRIKSDATSSPSKSIKSPYLQSPKKQLPKMETLMRKKFTLIKIHGNLLMKVS